MSTIVSAPAQDVSMYEAYYGFVQTPFTLAPDPRFLYLSESHDEAIRALLLAIRRKEGFIVLTGDIGTGKTTLCRALIDQLDRSTFTSLVVNPFVSVEELLRDVLLDFGVVSRDAVRRGRLASATRHELISTLHDFLLSLIPLHGSAVLIIDEAQHLSADVLEQIRVLSNLETNEGKLLQIVLIGQLNLLDILAAAEMRQLNQRISLRAVLKPLGRTEAAAYIAHRMAVARAAAPVSFDARALDRIHAIAGGVPRAMNLLCDRSLAAGARERTSVITAAHVDEAAASLGMQPPGPVAPAPARLASYAAAGAAAVLLTLGALVAAGALIDTRQLPAPASPPAVPLPRGIAALPIPAEPPPLPRRRPLQPRTEPSAPGDASPTLEPPAADFDPAL